MKFFNWLLLTIVLSPFLTASCSRTNVETGNGVGGYGTVEFLCNASAEIQYFAASKADGSTRELPGNVIPQKETLVLDISNAEGFMSHYDTFSAYDQPYLLEGEYSAVFSYGDPDAEGPEAAYFEAVHPFTVVARKTTAEQVAVSLANSVFSAVFSQWFVDYYPEFEILIETESGYSVSFTQSGIDPLSESSPVFVKADTNLYLSGTAVKTNGAEVSFPKTEIAVTKPCTWQTVSIDASQASNGSIEIILEDTVKEIKEISVELNPDAPGQDAMSAGEKN